MTRDLDIVTYPWLLEVEEIDVLAPVERVLEHAPRSPAPVRRPAAVEVHGRLESDGAAAVADSCRPAADPPVPIRGGVVAPVAVRVFLVYEEEP